LGSPALAHSAAELWLTKIHFERANHTFGVIGLFLTKFGFLSHNFQSRKAGKLIKPSKDSDYSLVSKNELEPKNGLLGCRPGPDKIGQK